MKLSISQPQFLQHLQIVERAINDRSALPILANVLLETKDNALVLTATDLDVGIRCRLPLLEKGQAGAATLPARRLSSLVRELPDESVLLETRKNHSTTLICGRSQFRLQGLPAEDFPVFPEPPQDQTVTVSQEALKRMIVWTGFAMSMEETRFILNGALLKLDGNTLTLAATDGRRLAVATADALSHTGAPARAVLPAKTVRELGRLLQGEASEPVVVSVLKDNQVSFAFDGVTIISRLVDGQFPSYEGVIPAPSPITLVCGRSLLWGAIRRAGLMTTAASQAVVFELQSDRLVVSKESAEIGSAREELPAMYTGDAMTVAFNPEFWLDALKVLDVDDLAIELAGPDKPAVVRLPNFLYVILPMKLG